MLRCGMARRTDRNISTAAWYLIQRHGVDALFEAEERADQLLAEGDTAGAKTWRHIAEAIERIEAAKPMGWRTVH